MIAVLTGDIVASTSLSPQELKRLQLLIKLARVEFRRWESVKTVAYAARAGDSWQLAIDEPRFALRAALYIHATLRSIDGKYKTKIAIAAGDGIIPSRNLNHATGPAYIASGRLLETLSASHYMDHADGHIASAMILLAAHIADGWTQAQAATVLDQLKLPTPTRDETAKRRKVTRQTVNKALWSAGFPAISKALSVIEEE